MKARASLLLGSVIIFTVLLVSCSGTAYSEPAKGKRANPLLPGETITLNGMEIKSDHARYVVDITYLDAIRGEEALDIYLLGSSNASANDIPKDKDLVIAKLTLHVRETVNDAPVMLESDGTQFFKAVSGGGVTYSPFLERDDMRENLFHDLYEGAEQTAHRFFMVDKSDSDPLMVIHPEIDGGLWFRLTVEEYQRTDPRIDRADWGGQAALPDDQSADAFNVSGDFAGTLADPLPMGYWGQWRIDFFSTGNINILEMMLEDVERGEKAAERLLSTSTSTSARSVSLTERQELMAVRLAVHVLHNQDDVGVMLFESNFELIAPDRRPVDATVLPPYYSTASLPTGFPGASFSGWLFFIVEKDDVHFLLSPSGYSGGRLWMSTDPAAEFPAGKDMYVPQHDRSIGERDPNMPAGSMQNPIPAGAASDVRIDGYMDTVEAEIEILEVIRGGGVLGSISSRLQPSVWADIPEGHELVSVVLRIRVDSTAEDQPAPFFSSLHLVGENHVGYERVLDGYMEKPIGDVYPGAEVVGRAVFIVDQSVSGLLLRVSETVFSPGATWFELPAAVSPEESRYPIESAGNENAMTAEQRRGLAFGAVLATRNILSFEYLQGFDPNALNASEQGAFYGSIITRDWGIADHTRAVAAMDRLAEGMHHRVQEGFGGYDHIFAIATGKRQPTLRERLAYRGAIAAVSAVTEALKSDFHYTQEELDRVATVSAWDYDRLAAVSRMCYAAGWLTEEQVWAYIDKAAEAGAADYDDWRGYFAGVMYGRAIWSGDASLSSTNTYIAYVLLGADSIYNKVPLKQD